MCNIRRYLPIGLISNVDAKENVSYSQLVRTANFDYDRNASVGVQYPEQTATEDFDLPMQPSLGLLGDEIDMPNYIPYSHKNLKAILL